MSLDIDATALLPADESGYGFDNVTVGDLPPALLDRYISAAQKISRLAIGTTQTTLQSDVIRIDADTTQEEHVPGLPIGTRGGVLVSYTFAQDGEYDIQVRLARNRTGNIGGLRDPRPHELELLLDREQIAMFTIQKPEDGDDSLVDSNLKIRVSVTAGPHDPGCHVSQDRLVTTGDRARASPVALQRNSSSSVDAGHLPSVDHGSVWTTGSR